MSLVCLECEIERRAAVHFTFRPNPAAMPMDDALHIREPDAGALEFPYRVQPLEDGEKFIRISHVEAGAIVADETNKLTVLRNLTHLDVRIIALAGELPGIAEKVLKHNLKQPGVSDSANFRGNDHVDRPVRMIAAQARQNDARDGREVYRRAVDFGTAHSRQR